MAGHAATPGLLRPVDAQELEDYPFPKGTRLETHSYFQFHFDRWLESDFYTRTSRKGDWDVQGLAVAIWCKARKQDPVGTMPSDQSLIADLLGLSMQTWEGYLRRDPSPLYGWRPCRVGADVRLMHPVVTEVVEAAMDSRNRSADRAVADRERKALTRLRRSLKELGFEAIAEQAQYVVRLNAWLDDHYPEGNRTPSRIVAGVEALTRR